MKPINNVRELRQALAEGRCEFRLLLNGGVFSRKSIFLSGDRFLVMNNIDGSEQKLTGRELYTLSNIGKAMRLGAFVAEVE